MSKIKGFNEYKMDGNSAIVFIKRKSGDVFETLVDLDILNRLIDLNYSWFVACDRKNKRFYVRRIEYLGSNPKPKYRILSLHNFILPPSDGQEVDHISRNTLDNRRSNLRLLTHQDNSRNRGPNKNNTSGYRNVSWNRGERVWMVQVVVNGKNTRVATTNDLEEAGRLAEHYRNIYYPVSE